MGDVPCPRHVLQSTEQKMAARLTLIKLHHPQVKYFWRMCLKLTTGWTSGQAKVATGLTCRYRLIWDSSVACKNHLSKGRSLTVCSGLETQNIKVLHFKWDLAQLNTPPLKLEVNSCALWPLYCTLFPLYSVQKVNNTLYRKLLSYSKNKFQCLVRTLFQFSHTFPFTK